MTMMTERPQSIVATTIHRITTVHGGWRQSERALVDCPIGSEPVDVSRCQACPHVRQETAQRVYCAVEMASDVSIEPGTVGAAMTRDVLCLSPAVCIEDAARLLIERRIGAVPVVDVDQRVLGLLSRSDVLPVLLQRVVGGGGNGALLDSFDADLMTAHARGETVAEIMTKGVLSLTPNEPLERAAELFAARQIHRAPVIGWSGAVVGMCTTFDLVKALAGANAGSS